MADRAKFWNRIAAKYEADPISDEHAYQKKLDITRSHFTPDMRVLEFGCGTGTTAVSHAPFVKHIHGIDISENMLAYAREKARNAGVENVDFEVIAIENFPENQEPYDMVLGLSILHLLPNPERTLQRVFSLTKPGGLFISSTACVGENSPLLRLIIPLGATFGLLPQVNFWRQGEVVSLIEQAGFTIETQWSPGPKKALFVVARRPEET